MTTALVVLFGIVASTAFAQSPPAPFATVALRGGVVVASLPRTGARRLVQGDSAQPRLSTYGETFQLQDGAALTFAEKHVSYRVACHISPAPSGLQVEYTFDAHSFGGTITKKSYFIKAQ